MADGRREVLLFADGGNGRGYGNVYRSTALAQAFSSLACGLTFITDAPGWSAPWLPFSVVAIPRADLIRTIGSILQPGRQPSVLGIDSRTVSLPELRELRSLLPGTLLVHLNDSGLPHLDEYDAVVDFDELDRNIVSHPRVVRGLEYTIVREEVRRLRDQAAVSIPNSLREVTICMGAEDPGCVTEAVLVELTRASALDLSVTVVCGRGFDAKRFRTIDSIVRLRQPSWRTLFDPAEFPTLLARSDLVVTLGGQTSLEACCLGIPNAAVQWGWLSPYVQNLCGRGLALDLGHVGEAGLRLTDLLAERPWEELQSLVHVGWHLIDGAGAVRLAARLLAMSEGH